MNKQIKEKVDMSKRESIENTIKDMVTDLLYYDRKEDEDLPRGAIEQAIKDGDITVQDIVALFEHEIHRAL